MNKFYCREEELSKLNARCEIITKIGETSGTCTNYVKTLIDLGIVKKEKQVQIDIVGTPVEGKEYIIGSCKYSNEKIGVVELELLREYAAVFGRGIKYHYYIFSKGGFTEALKQAADGGEVTLVSLEEMYADK